MSSRQPTPPTVSQRSRYAPIAEERRTDSAWCPEPGAAPANLRGTTSRIRSTLRIDKDGRMILSCRQQVCSFHPLSCLGPRATDEKGAASSFSSLLRQQQMLLKALNGADICRTIFSSAFGERGRFTTKSCVSFSNKAHAAMMQVAERILRYPNRPLPPGKSEADANLRTCHTIAEAACRQASCRYVDRTTHAG